MSGPASVTFSTPTALKAEAIFSQAGSYVLQLSVTTDLGVFNDTLNVEVLPAAHNTLTPARSSHGQDFWLTFLKNAGAEANSLTISSTQDDAGELEFYDPDCHCH